MTDFDELIKEKIEQKEYSYSASSWRSFTRKAKMNMTTHYIKIGISIASIISLSIVGIFILKTTHSSSHSNTPDTEINTIIPSDTCEATISTPTLMDTLSFPPYEKNENVVKKYQKNKKETIDSTDIKKTTLDTLPPTIYHPQSTKPFKTRRILEINTDTIKSND